MNKAATHMFTARKDIGFNFSNLLFPLQEQSDDSSEEEATGDTESM